MNLSKPATRPLLHRDIELLPDWESIPACFKRSCSDLKCRKLLELVEKWFYSGLVMEDMRVEPKPGIVLTDALKHLSVCMRSFVPSQEYKMAGVAFLIDQWFDKFEEKS